MHEQALVFVYVFVIASILALLYKQCSEHFESLTTTQERQLVTQQQTVAATAANGSCFDCGVFYGGAMSQTDASTVLDYIQKQDIYVKAIFDKIEKFITNRTQLCAATTIPQYIDCFKKYLSVVECPHAINDPSCKLNETLGDLIISKASMCLAKNTCKSMDDFESFLKTEINAQKEAYAQCRIAFADVSGPCIDLYVNAIQSRTKQTTGDDSQLLVTNAQLKEALNKNASFAFQANNY